MRRIGVAVVVMAMGVVGVRADDAVQPTTKPTTQEAPLVSPPARRTSSRLTQPWSKLTTLSEDQRVKIIDIHRNALDAKKAIEQKERADIVGLLTDPQKVELLETEEKTVVTRKMAQKPADSGMTSAK